MPQTSAMRRLGHSSFRSLEFVSCFEFRHSCLFSAFLWLLLIRRFRRFRRGRAFAADGHHFCFGFFPANGQDKNGRLLGLLGELFAVELFVAYSGALELGRFTSERL